MLLCTINVTLFSKCYFVLQIAGLSIYTFKTQLNYVCEETRRYPGLYFLALARTSSSLGRKLTPITEL